MSNEKCPFCGRYIDEDTYCDKLDIVLKTPQRLNKELLKLLVYGFKQDIVSSVKLGIEFNSSGREITIFLTQENLEKACENWGNE
jgi:hypothetical protein